jgi:hypothetical protein
MWLEGLGQLKKKYCISLLLNVPLVETLTTTDVP